MHPSGSTLIYTSGGTFLVNLILNSPVGGWAEFICTNPSGGTGATSWEYNQQYQASTSGSQNYSLALRDGSANINAATFTGNLVGTASNVTTNANLTGAVTSVGNSTSLGSFNSSSLAGALTDETGSGSAVFATSLTFVTPALGAATATTINKVTITSPSSGATLTIANGKTFTVNNSLAINATDGITETTPTTSFTAARTDAANTFTGHQTIEGVTSTGATGSGNFVFSASPSITGTLTTAAVAASGSILTTSTAGIGYGTGSGAGGTVSQSTSKSTGVTLNKPTGQITMNAAALAAGTIISFTVTNSAVAATDNIVIQHQSGGTLGSYTINAASASGLFTVYVRNNTSASLSEAIVLQFSDVKGSTN